MTPGLSWTGSRVKVRFTCPAGMRITEKIKKLLFHQAVKVHLNRLAGPEITERKKSLLLHQAVKVHFNRLVSLEIIECKAAHIKIIRPVIL